MNYLASFLGYNLSEHNWRSLGDPSSKTNPEGQVTLPSSNTIVPTKQPTKPLTSLFWNTVYQKYFKERMCLFSFPRTFYQRHLRPLFSLQVPQPFATQRQLQITESSAIPSPENRPKDETPPAPKAAKLQTVQFSDTIQWGSYTYTVTQNLPSSTPPEVWNAIVNAYKNLLDGQTKISSGVKTLRLTLNPDNSTVKIEVPQYGELNTPKSITIRHNQTIGTLIAIYTRYQIKTTNANLSSQETKQNDASEELKEAQNLFTSFHDKLLFFTKESAEKRSREDSTESQPQFKQNEFNKMIKALKKLDPKDFSTTIKKLSSSPLSYNESQNGITSLQIKILKDLQKDLNNAKASQDEAVKPEFVKMVEFLTKLHTRFLLPPSAEPA